MAKVLTNTLIGAHLNWAVAYALGYPKGSPKTLLGKRCKGFGTSKIEWEPSTNWGQGGLLLEQFQCWPSRYYGTPHNPDEEFKATIGLSYARGKTALIAAMRCIVKHMVGGEIDIPEDVLSS